MDSWSKALVTGASSGIGKAMAEYLAAIGTKVVLVARDEARMKEMAALAPDKMEVMPADLSKPKDLEKLEEYLKSEEIDLLVNNAGIWEFKSFTSQPPQDVEQMLNVNLVALVKLCHAAVGGMKERKKGAILNVSSIAGGQPMPMEALYSSTKSFVTNFSQGLHAELKDQGITVTVLLPGLVRTELHERGKGEKSVNHLPSFVWMNSWPVAEIALKAVAEGKPVCVPGTLNKFVSGAVEITPRPVLRYFGKRVMKNRRKANQNEG